MNCTNNCVAGSIIMARLLVMFVSILSIMLSLELVAGPVHDLPIGKIAQLLRSFIYHETKQ